MKAVHLEVGQASWIHTGGPKKDEGEVVHVFRLYDMTHYVVAIDTHVDPVLYVRHVFSVIDHKDKPIGILRR